MIQIQRTTTGQEPVTLIDVRNYMKVDYEIEDAIIWHMIKGVRELFEELTGLSLIAQTITYFNDTIDDEIELPYPNHTGITSVYINGELSTAYNVSGLSRKIVYPNATANSRSNECGIKITYTSDGKCPQALKIAILKEVEELYRNRGNSFEGSIVDLSMSSMAIISKYTVL